MQGSGVVTEVVAALIYTGERLMICQRPAEKARGLLWEFVGGKVEPGETGPEALIRECREELGITVAVGDVFCTVEHVYPDITIHLTLYRCTIQEGTPVLYEHAALRWVSPEELDAYPFCPADKEILALIQKEAGTE
jgi:8-oxo-dGTP diphosphatase